MAASEQIKRIQIDPFGLDFDTLKKDGLALVQGLSGAIWTDYNPHDPGVTILEQLCYGLTELAYRSGFEMQDYLASKNGSIDFEQLALFKPEAIFPSQAVTINDYCKLLFAAIPDLDDVRFLPVLDEEQRPNGLYKVSVKLYEPLDQARHDPQQHLAIIAKVKAIFAAHRSLCEDIVAVDVLQTQPCFLQGEIEIQGNRPPAEIYAEIFFKCARKISSNIRIERYEDMLAQGMSREQIFTGPLTAQGYINDCDFEDTRATPTMAELVALVSKIEGVKQVHRLDLVNEKGVSLGDDFSCDVTEAGLPSLRFPAQDQHLHLLKLVFQPSNKGHSAPVSSARQTEIDIKERFLLEAAKLQLQKLEFEYRAFRNNENAVSQFITLPRGEYRNFKDYYSIQDQFPHIYGINRAGIPNSEPPEVKAKAKQLKAYLFPFEQLMANYLQTLQQLPRLFSLDDSLRQSYFSQYLTDDNLPDIEALYATQGGEAVIAEIQARYDSYADRRSRVLDVMLAMYGEEFFQEALQRFNYYRQADTGQWVIENKIHFLRNLTEVSCNRASAFNPLKPPAQDNIGSWHKRIGILLGIQQFDNQRSLCAVFNERNIEMMSDEAYHELAQTRALAPDFEEAIAVPLLNEEHPGAQLALRLKDCKLSESMLRQGYDLSHYRLVVNAKETMLYFQGNPQDHLYRLAALPQKSDAIVSARQFRNAMVELNQACEGLHVVEHLLLRSAADAGLTVEDDFYAFRLSIVFPAWTARFADPEFRKLAEETVCRQLPSHLCPSFYWLDFAQMSEFERLQQAWLEALSNPETASAASSAADLAGFLQQHRSDHIQTYWV